MTDCLLPLFPLSLSVNECFRNVQKRGRVKTQAYRSFEMACQSWAHQNPERVELLQELSKRVGPGVGLRCRYVFYFKPERILTKSQTNPKGGAKRIKQRNESKQLDVSNFIKACEDQVFKMAGIDDAYVWEVVATKAVASLGREHTNVIVELMTHPTLA